MRNRIAVGFAVLALVLLLAPAAQASIVEQLAVSTQSLTQCSTDIGCGADLTSTKYPDFGSVDVSQENAKLTVTFTVDKVKYPDLRLVATYVELTFTPQEGAPVILVATKDLSASPVATYTEEIDLTDKGIPAGSCVQFKAGGDVQDTTITAEELANIDLPASVTMSVTYPVAGGAAYFPTVAVSGGGEALDGVYSGWCVDNDLVINQNTIYTATVYSSYEDLPDGYFENENDFDRINWIINQNFVGKAATDALEPDAGGNGLGESLGIYTYGDLQVAIWTLVEGSFTNYSGVGSYSQNRVNEILAAAEKSGEGFVPQCGDKFAVILVPVNSAQLVIAQATLIDKVIPCTSTKDSFVAEFCCCLDGEIIVKKITDPASDTETVFSFSASYDQDGFTLKNGEQDASGFLAAGTYSVSEEAKTGWITQVKCTSDDPDRVDAIDPAAIVLADSEVVTCTFTNTQLGSLDVTKRVNVVAGMPTTTSFEICVVGPVPAATETCAIYSDGDTLIVDFIVPGDYTIIEKPLTETGWTVTGSGVIVTVAPGGSASAEVINTFEREDEFGCTYTQGYWKTHADPKKKQYDPTWAEVGGPNAPFFLSGQTYLKVMQMPSADGNVYYILAQQYIAAKLNSFVASTPQEVDDAIAAAKDFFETYTPAAALELAPEMRQTYINYATTLDNYNNGLIGPGHCD